LARGGALQRFRSPGWQCNRKWPYLRYGRRFSVAKNLNRRYNDSFYQKEIDGALIALAVDRALPITPSSTGRHGRACPGYPRRNAANTSPALAPPAARAYKCKGFWPLLLTCGRSMRRTTWMAGTSQAMTLNPPADLSDAPNLSQPTANAISAKTMAPSLPSPALARRPRPESRREAAKPLKWLKTAMDRSCRKLAWVWVRRHVGLGLAPHPFGVGAPPAWGQHGARRKLPSWALRSTR